MNSSSNYGTIPTATLPHAPPTFLSRATVHSQSLSSNLRPWRDLLDPHSLSTPYSYPEAQSRIKSNLYHFRFNYALILLIILFLTLIYHPFSMIAFLFVFVGWVFAYFSRDGPLVVFGRAVDDRVVFCVMGFVTIVVLVITHVGLNVLVGLAVGVLVIGLHAGFRGSEDLFLDEDDAAEGGLVSVVAGTSGGGDRPMRAGFGRV